MKRSRSAAFGMTATETLSPARLNVLLGAISVIVRRSISGPSEAIGTWRWPREEQVAVDLVGDDRQVALRQICGHARRARRA